MVQYDRLIISEIPRILSYNPYYVFETLTTKHTQWV
jgi:hypothetical protein